MKDLRRMLFALALSACSAFGASSTETPPAAPPPDAAAPDGGAPAGTDAALPAQDAGARFCDGQQPDGLILCEDFDAPTLSGYSVAWTESPLVTGAQRTTETAPPGGDGRALHVDLANVDPGSATTLSMDLPSGSVGTDKTFTLTYRVFVAALQSFDFARIGAFVYTNESTLTRFGAALVGGQFGTDDDKDHAAIQVPFNLGEWYDVVATATHQVNGKFLRQVSAGGAKFDNVPDLTFAPDGVTYVKFGATDTGQNSKALDLWIDDIVLRAK